MSQRLTLPAPAAAALLGASLLLLGGCEAIYDDTKGWANRLEASILEAAHELEEDPDAGEQERYTPETEDGAPKDATAEGEAGGVMMAMTPKPRPEGTPILIEPNPAEDLRQDDLILDELPNPTEPEPNKEAKDTSKPDNAVAGDAVTSGAVAGAAEALTEKAAPAAKDAKATKEMAGKEAEKPAAMAKQMAAPPTPERKPQDGGKAKVGDDVTMVLHLSSLRSEQAAKREWSDLQRDYPKALGEMKAEIRRTELGDKGTFYRVLAGPLPSRKDAKEACDAVKSKNAKQYCRVLPSKPKS